MERFIRKAAVALWSALLGLAVPILCQTAEGPPDWILIPAYPPRATDPAAVARGRGLYTANGCSFCHGVDARGGNGGPSLLRSQRLMRDKNGEVISEPILKGVPNTAMVAFPLNSSEVADIAEFLHSFPASGADKARDRPVTIVTGDAAAGKRYFAKSCAGCHSADGDLKGLGTRIADPRSLQQRWLMPGSGAKTRVVVSGDGSGSIEGMLVRIDEFLVTVGTADGTQRTFERKGDVPKVRIEDPLVIHKEMLSSYTDRDIHNVTAYLVTLK